MFDSHTQHENRRTLREAVKSRICALLDAGPGDPTDEEWHRTLCTAYYLLERESTDDPDYLGHSVCGGCLHRCREDNWCKERSGFVDPNRWACPAFIPR